MHLPSVRFSITVMAHPNREEWAKELAKDLGASIVWDEISNVWDTGRRSLLDADFSKSHHLVIQDDALPAVGFLDACEEIIERHPENPIGLYCSYKLKRQIKRAKLEGKRYLRAEGPRWGVAVITPTPHIEKMVAHCDRLDISNYDLRMMDYWQSRGVQCIYPLPSLVNHRPVGENPSLASAERNTTRRAIWATEDARGIDW